jgi:PAS domain S-box-containing protein
MKKRMLVPLAKEKKEVPRKAPVTAEKLRLKARRLAVTAKENENIRDKLAVTAKQLAVSAREKEDVRNKLAVTAEKLRIKAEQLAVTANEKEDARSNLAVTAKQLAGIAVEKEDVRRKLAVTAKQLAVTAKEKEDVRRKLAVTAKQLAVTAKEKEDVRRKLAVTAKQLAVTAKEKEDVRRKLAVTARQLAAIAKEKEDVRRKLAIAAKEKEIIRDRLAVTAKKLAVTAREKEDVRRKLAVTAEELSLKAEQQIKIKTKLKESEIRYRRLFETGHDGILILNSQTGQITDVNPFLERLLGYSKSEFLNKKLWEVGAFKNVRASMDAFEIFKKGGHLRYEDLPLETKSGQQIEVEFVSNSYMAGAVRVIQCNIRDITERKKLELAKETSRLLEEERLKVESIADATHELRTPLAIIKGNVDLAMRSQLKNPKPPKSALRAINYEIKHLSSILSDLTLITSNKADLINRIVYNKVNLRQLLVRVIGRCRTLAYKKNISITASKIPDLTILGDKAYLEKMLANLIKNSIDYGKENGHTEILARESKGFIIITISDDGAGIAQEDLPHVFERFYRADKFQSSGGSGTGLGLAIVKWIAEVHGGEVSVKNIENKGSVFSVSLPLKAKARP